MQTKQLKFYMAPMEGITGYVFRNAYHDYFPAMDRYFTPFISPTQNKLFSPKEYRDILPEHNEGKQIVPQLLTNQAELFLKASGELKAMGYEIININLGCPSGTVVSKEKGAGFLQNLPRLTEFFERIFEKSPVKISVKTRLGMERTEEFQEILDVLKRYPFEEVIVHPRVRQEFYKGSVHRESFTLAQRQLLVPLGYNGDIFHAEQLQEFELPVHDKVTSIMLGRGILRNPGLLQEYKNGRRAETNQVLEFSDRLLADYGQLMGERNSLFRMKELWLYLVYFFPNPEKGSRKIKKASSAAELKAAVRELARG